MPTATPDLVLNDAQTSTGAGAGLIGFGERVRYSKGAGVNRNVYPKKFRVAAALTDSTTGATATLTIEHSDDNSSWSTLGTMSLSLATGSQKGSSRKLFSTKKKWIRGNVSALAGGSAPTVDAYVVLGTM
jgi:hypothetical protein